MPLPPLLLSLLAGLVLAPYLPFERPALSAAVAALLLLVAFFLPFRWRILPACCGVCLLAFSLVTQAQRPPEYPNALHRFVGAEPLAVTGEVYAVGRSSSGNLYYDLQVERLINRGLEIPVNGNLRLYLDASEAPFVAGDRLSFMGRLRRPRLFGTPGEFDFVRYLARRGIFTLAYVKRPEAIARLAVRREASLFERWRQSNAGLIRRALPHRPDLAGLVRALAQGERLDVSPQQRELLASGGIAHLFAISGLHFGLVAAGLYLAGAWWWRRSTWLLELCPPRRLLPLLLLPLLYGYLHFCGGAISSWRAFLMLAAGALVMVSLRRVSALRALAAVALVLLLSDPLLVYEAGFQLSFAATLGILLVVRRCYPLLRERVLWQRYPLLVMVTTLSATLATLPFMLLHFQQFAPAGALTNLLAVPLVSFLLLPLALLGTLLGPLCPVAARTCFSLCGDLLEGLLRGVESLLNWPGLAARDWAPSLSEWWLVCLLLVGVGLLFAGRRRLTACALLVACCTMLPWGEKPAIALTALSVGHGEALLVSFGGDRHVLVDAGGFPGSSYDVGERLVAPALARLGVKRLDAVVLTHEHPDHMLGLAKVLERVPCSELWTNVAQSRLPETVQQRLVAGDLMLHVPSPGWQDLGAISKGLQLFSPGEADNANDRSLVVYLRRGVQGALLCGDLEHPGVAQLLAEPPPGPVTLLKLPHHGSRHSAQEKLLDGFEPEVALVSAGNGGRYRLPHPDTLALYAQSAVPLWRTDLHGTLRLATDGLEWRVTRWKEGAFR